jgi:dipeptidyl aminopeptidase/acylaminoacyl peptidase
MKYALSLVLLCIASSTMAQKKILNHSDFDIWNRIQRQTMASDGNFIMYSLQKGEKDSQLKIKDKNGDFIFEHERSEKGQFTYDSKFVIFSIKEWKDSILEMKRRKVKKNKMPKDTLGIYNLKNHALEKIAHIKSYKIPQKWSGFVAYTYDVTKKNTSKNLKKVKDSIVLDTSYTKKKAIKKASSKTGYPLVIKNLITASADTIYFVTNYVFSKESKKIAYTTTGNNANSKPGVYIINLETMKKKHIFSSHDKTKYYQLNFSDSGKNLGFVTDADTTKTYVRPNRLYAWNDTIRAAELIVDNTTSPIGYRVSSDGDITFSKDDTKLYFGLALPEVIKDTLLLQEEIVNVEVWTYNEPRLYTVQEKQVKDDKKKSFQTVYHLNHKKLIQIATKEYPNASLGDEGNAAFALVSTTEPYALEAQWTGQFSANDLAIVNINDGSLKMAIKKAASTVRLSPRGNYAYGYNQVDSTWFTYNISSAKYLELTKKGGFYNELNDSPNHPRSYGSAGWTKDDNSLILYDRYDIWEFNPDNGKGTKLTDGRQNKITYRHVKLDRNKRYIDTSKKLVFTTFNENTKYSGFYAYNYKKKSGKSLLKGPYRYAGFRKARLSDDVMFTRQSFQEFPNIRVSNLTFKSQTVVSDANPQQKNYNWGTAELVHWTSLDGLPLTGMLIKPENFDPNKKYPMIVNFYEKSSNNLYTHKAPNPGRSTINYSFYASRGYLIFNPDVYYRVGYPGESAFNCVIPGITSLIEKGFVDADNIGTQGHSWGGYQIAYLVTKTDIFKAAESGAPVVNMISAFGGIRWDTGLSRQFQYEHTQSRIGGTPWEYPQRYFENSPIYNLDKVNTPLLIMHNDADGHVPWYQGIEFFVSLRRLGKPSWLLNYNGARHWPLKMQNRKDFNIRMQQFFDHYLQNAPKPVWMDRGVPALEKGINQGYELIKNK